MYRQFKPRWRIVLAVTIIITITIISVIFFLTTKVSRETELEKDIKTHVGDVTGTEKIPEKFQEYLDLIESPEASEEEKFTAFDNLSFYMSASYSETHDPKIREFAKNVLDPYYKSKYPSIYNDSLFNFECSDPVCGQELTPELNQLIVDISKNSLEKEEKDVIIRNLKTAGYIKDSELEDKKVGMQIVVEQLERYGDTSASNSAKFLREYLFRKYKMEL